MSRQTLISLVIDTDNPQVYFAIPGPEPIEYPDPLWGYGYSHRLAKFTWGSTLIHTCGGQPAGMHLDRVINYIKINYKIQNNQVKIEKGAGEGRGMARMQQG